MPHCVLEYTNKDAKKEDFLKFFENLHNLLVATKEFRLEAIKSRAVLLDCYYMGNGDENNEFYFLNIAILKGRSEEFRKILSNKVLDLMKKNFKKSENSNGFSLAVNIHELNTETYSRYYEEN